MLVLRLAITYLKRRKLRTILTTLSVIIAIATLVSIRGITGSLDFVTKEVISQIGGRAQLEVKGSISGMSQDRIAEVKALDEVDEAVPMIQMTVQTKELEGYIVALGIDSEQDQRIRTYRMIEGRLPALGKYELAVPESLLRGKSIGLGDTLTIQQIDGFKQYKIVGVLEDGGVTSVNNGMIIFMPLDIAQVDFGLGSKISAISVVVKDSTEVEEVQSELQQVLGSAYKVEPSAARSSDLDNVLVSVKGMYNVLGSMGLFLALFVVYNTMAVAVAEQRTHLGILRALGWRKSDVRTLIMWEAFFFGLVGGLLGLVLGKHLANGALKLVAVSIEEWLRISLPMAHLTWIDYIAILVLGIVTCMVSAWIPANKAAQVLPVEAMRKEYKEKEKRYSLKRVIFGLVLVIISPILMATGSGQALPIVAGYSGLSGLAIILPFLLIALLKIIETLIKRVLSFPGQLGLSSFRRSPRRVVVTGMPVILGLGISLGILSGIDSLKTTMENWIEELVNPDIVISEGVQVTGNNVVAFPEVIIDKLKRYDEVEAVVGRKLTKVSWRNKDLDLLAVDAKEWEKFANPPILETDKLKAMQDLSNGNQVWITKSLQLTQGLQVGQFINLSTPSGTKNFKIAAVVKDYSAIEGGVYINRTDYIKYWGDSTINSLHLTVKPEIDPKIFRDKLEADLKTDYKAQIMLAAEMREKHMAGANGLYSIFYLMVPLTLLVGSIGIANSLLVSILERERETGVLRSLGMFGKEVRFMYLTEVVSLLAATVILSIPVAVFVYFDGTIMNENIVGWTIEHHLNSVTILGTIFAVLIAAWLSSFYPAWKGSKVNPIEALRAE